MTDIGTLPGFDDSWAFGINDVDQVVGNSFRSSSIQPSTSGFLWPDLVVVDLEVLFQWNYVG